MDKKELIAKITQKKEFSQLTKKDLELAFKKFDKQIYCDIEKVKLTRDLLRKVFSVFTSRKLLLIKNKSFEEILKKHLSTKERFDYYFKIYKRILKGISGKVWILDLGCGVNGFSYPYFKKIGCEINYIGIESIGQLVELSNHYFRKNKIKGELFHESLFELPKIKKIIKKAKEPRIIFLFKVIDSLEMLKKDYSKILLRELTPFADKIVVSFATRSLIKRKKFLANKKWLVDFIKDNFKILDNFEYSNEKYIVFRKNSF